jgi:hypothetical protein
MERMSAIWRLFERFCAIYLLAILGLYIFQSVLHGHVMTWDEYDHFMRGLGRALTD